MKINKVVNLMYYLYQEIAQGPNATDEEIFKEVARKQEEEWLIKWYESFRSVPSKEEYWDMLYDFCNENNFEIEYDY